MGLPDSSLVGLMDRVWSWVYWGYSDMNFLSHEVDLINNDFKMRCSCGLDISNLGVRYKCHCCGSLLCNKCVDGLANLDVVATNSRLLETSEVMIEIKSCKLCFKVDLVSESAKMFHDKVYPSESPRSPEPQSLSLSGGKVEYYPSAASRSSDEPFPGNTSPVSSSASPGRCDDDVEDDAKPQYLCASSDCPHDSSDADFVCGGIGHGLCGFMPFGSSISDSPSCNSNKVEHHEQQLHSETLGSQVNGTPSYSPAILGNPAKGVSDIVKVDDLSIVQNKVEELPKQLNFETNSLIWLPPPPDDLSVETNFFTYDDEDDEVGDSGALFSSTTDLDCISLAKEKQHADLKESLRTVVQGHFRDLVTDLLQAQGILLKDNDDEGWLNIITRIASQAADFIKPDTSDGGSMDPCDYVKIKCVASGNPSESKIIKGIVCTKNIKHKRMASQYRKTKLLLLGGSLEYQRDPSHLASFETLLQQENEHLKMIVSKIVACRPNVLLVEKSVSSSAQDLLLAKEISLVLNVKRPLLDRIARCSGATICPSADHLSIARLGHCELFHLEKVTEEHEPANQLSKKPLKTLMYFEGCPRRLGCTVLLRGSSREKLKKVKKVVQYAVFAAYNLSLESSFLADEGVTVPKTGASHYTAENMAHDVPTSIPDSVDTMNFKEITGPLLNAGSVDLSLELGLQKSMSELGEVGYDDVSVPEEMIYRNILSKACEENLSLNLTVEGMKRNCPSIKIQTPAGCSGDISGLGVALGVEDMEATVEYSPVNGINQSILVSFSCRNILNGTVCERSRLIRLKFYGTSDQPFGMYLRNLFDKSTHCPSCKESAEVHTICYTHQHGNLMINVKFLSSVSLPGEQDGKIWMWHRCLRCTHVEGVPPATRRVVMSDAAWGLSFGKFLQLNFSTHATGNLVASCGHSLQRDCLWFYGFGSMVAFFRYSPINILSVRLPPFILEFSRPGEESWIREEASELLSKSEVLYEKLAAALQNIYDINSSLKYKYDASDLHCHILELIHILDREKKYYRGLLQSNGKENFEQEHTKVDILEINQLRHSLLTGSRDWDRRLYLLRSLLRESSSPKAPNDAESFIGIEDCGTCLNDNNELYRLQNSESVECSNKAVQSNEALPKLDEDAQESHILPPLRSQKESNGICQSVENDALASENILFATPILLDQMDSSQFGDDQALMKAKMIDILLSDVSEAVSVAKQYENDNSYRRRLSPTRVYSFDSLQRLQQRKRKVLRHVSHLSTLPSFNASGDYSYMLRDPISNVQWSSSQVSLHEAEKLPSAATSFFHSISLLPQGARLMIPQNGCDDDIVVTVYDDEPTSIISFALCSKEHFDWTGKKPNVSGRSSTSPISKGKSLCPDHSTLECKHNENYGCQDVLTTIGSHSVDLKSSPHLKVSFEDESLSSSGKVKFFVTCYFGKQFDALRRRCCPSEADFIRSISRCKKWSAQGGKSNAFFAKSLDERFIIKQVSKTEFDSFCEFGPKYFEYFTNALNSGNPTCLAKILGIYQVTVRYLNGGKERKMDMIVMENLFFKKNISKVYDLKGSTRSRYNSNTTGADKVLLDMNLLETLRTNPIFFGRESKRVLERAIWNDTSFLASAAVMDYSLLVGVDEDRKELVVGIIDYMRQYTWDKHLETWVKASGILGGPKNASPTIISPKQYKKRFRKAMTTYFLTVPDHWS